MPPTLATVALGWGVVKLQAPQGIGGVVCARGCITEKLNRIREDAKRHRIEEAVQGDPHNVWRDIQEAVGAAPIIKARANARTGTIDARGRALRGRIRHPTSWQRRYNRRPITEAVNSSLKRRFGDRLHCRGLWNQRQEMAIRILVYNIALKTRWKIRLQIQRGEL